MNEVRTDQIAQQARQQGDENEENFRREAPVDSMGELYQNLIFGDRSGYLEIDKHLASGYLKEVEIKALRRIGDIMQNIGMLEQGFGLDMMNSAHFFNRKMMFWSMISKSRSGFAIKEAGTDRIRADEKYMMGDPEEQAGGGIGEAIKNLIAGTNNSVGKGQFDRVMPSGDEIYGSYGYDERR